MGVAGERTGECGSGTADIHAKIRAKAGKQIRARYPGTRIISFGG